jgi:hypothetical protein
MKKFLKYLLIIVAVIALLAIGWKIWNSISARHIYRSFQAEIQNLTPKATQNYYGYIRQNDMEYYFLSTEGGERSCGVRNMLTGEETVYVNESRYFYASLDSEPNVSQGDAQTLYTDNFEKLQQMLGCFLEKAVVSCSGSHTVIARPFFWNKGSQIVSFSLAEENVSSAFSLPDCSFAYIIKDKDGSSVFTYNVTPNKTDVNEQMYLSIGRTTDELLAWEGHDVLFD